MKKFLLFLIVITLFSPNIFAKYVKFSVDMSGQKISPEGIHIAGDFQTAAGYSGGNWQPNTCPMSREKDTTIYSLVVNIPANKLYEYYFLNGDQWYESEFIPEESRVGYDFNAYRWIWVDSTASDTCFTGAIQFSGNAPAGKYLARYFVDMSNQSAISEKGVYLSGDFVNWQTNKIRLCSFSDKIYQTIIYLPSGDYSYKFYNGNSADKAEIVPSNCSVNGNRTLNLTSDKQIDTVLFSECAKSGSAVATEEKPYFSFQISPNPVTDNLSIMLNTEMTNSIQIQIFNLQGESVFLKKRISENSETINSSDLSAGVYILKLINMLNNSILGEKLFFKIY